MRDKTDEYGRRRIKTREGKDIKICKHQHKVTAVVDCFEAEWSDATTSAHEMV